MGSIPLDNGEHVYVHDGSGSMDPVAISAAEGSNLANLMKNRQRFDYAWANASKRTAQTGMVQGSRGYQVDTKTEWLYDAGAWRLAIPYAEFTGSDIPATGASTQVQAGGWLLDSGRTTDSTFVTVTGAQITFVQAGLYAVTAIGTGGGNADSAQLLNGSSTYGAPFYAISPHVRNVNMLVLPQHRTLSDGESLWLWLSGTTSAAFTSRRLRVSRLG